MLATEDRELKKSKGINFSSALDAYLLQTIIYPVQRERHIIIFYIDSYDGDVCSVFKFHEKGTPVIGNPVRREHRRPCREHQKILVIVGSVLCKSAQRQMSRYRIQTLLPGDFIFQAHGIAF